jgi:hypothetical protein
MRFWRNTVRSFSFLFFSSIFISFASKRGNQALTRCHQEARQHDRRRDGGHTQRPIMMEIGVTLGLEWMLCHTEVGRLYLAFGQTILVILFHGLSVRAPWLSNIFSFSPKKIQRLAMVAGSMLESKRRRRVRRGCGRSHVCMEEANNGMRSS